MNDPLWSRALRRPDGQVDHHKAFWQLLVEGAMRYRWVWITGGGEAASVWIPPGGTEISSEQEEALTELAKDRLGRGADTYFELLARFASAHPQEEPHYYLSLVGTHPEHRGHGYGVQLLAHNLAEIDAEHRASYLESSNPDNNRRYEALGFERKGAFEFPGGGPVVTTMWRPAR